MRLQLSSDTGGTLHLCRSRLHIRYVHTLNTHWIHIQQTTISHTQVALSRRVRAAVPPTAAYTQRTAMRKIQVHIPKLSTRVSWPTTLVFTVFPYITLPVLVLVHLALPFCILVPSPFSLSSVHIPVSVTVHTSVWFLYPLMNSFLCKFQHFL